MQPRSQPQGGQGQGGPLKQRVKQPYRLPTIASTESPRLPDNTAVTFPRRQSNDITKVSSPRDNTTSAHSSAEVTKKKKKDSLTSAEGGSDIIAARDQRQERKSAESSTARIPSKPTVAAPTTSRRRSSVASGTTTAAVRRPSVTVPAGAAGPGGLRPSFTTRQPVVWTVDVKKRCEGWVFKPLQQWFTTHSDPRRVLTPEIMATFPFDSGVKLSETVCEKIVSAAVRPATDRQGASSDDDSGEKMKDLYLVQHEFCAVAAIINTTVNAVYRICRAAFPLEDSHVAALEAFLKLDLSRNSPHSETLKEVEDVLLAVVSEFSNDTESLLTAFPFPQSNTLFAVAATAPQHYHGDDQHHASQAEHIFPLGMTDEDYALMKQTSRASRLELSESDKVLVKETWNKMLAWKDQAMEAFFLHWLTLCGSEDTKLLLRHFFEDVQKNMFEMLDLCVRQLQPETEVIARESYRGVHPKVGEFNTPLDYFQHWATIGLRPSHWRHARQAFLFALKSFVPYLEEDEHDDLAKPGHKSALKIFFDIRILHPAVGAVRELRNFFVSDECCVALPRHWKKIGLLTESGCTALGVKFFAAYSSDQLLGDYFVTSTQAVTYVQNFLETVQFATKQFPHMRDSLLNLGERYRVQFVPSWVHAVAAKLISDLINDIKIVGDHVKEAQRKVFRMCVKLLREPGREEEDLFAKAESFYTSMAKELSWGAETLSNRLTKIRSEIHETGMYRHTAEELQCGARVAWRNSAKCIGRISWNTLLVRDCRDINTEEEMFHECLEHFKVATAGPTIQSVMTVFEPRQKKQMTGPRFWNGQLYQYACYEQDDGTLLGDPASLRLTQNIQKYFGWEPRSGKRTRFDVLPLVIQLEGKEPKLFEIPPESVFEVNLTHPENPKFADLGLKWFTVPAISGFRTSLGGIDFCATPFNGWFMELEIGRNLCERYKVGPDVAKIFDLDTETGSLWQNRVYLEVARAVQHSFIKNKFTIVDHQTASRQFGVHCTREKAVGREVPAQWSWIGGLVGPTCPVWHHEMRDFHLDPQYHYQSAAHYAMTPSLFEDSDQNVALASPVGEKEGECSKVLILFGSETGTSESFATKLSRSLNGHDVTLTTINAAVADGLDTLPDYSHIFVITSTFDNGGIPSNANQFMKMAQLKLPYVTYSVLAVGSSAYENFCAFGYLVDRTLLDSGATRLHPVITADDLSGQFNSFTKFQALVMEELGTAPTTGKGTAYVETETVVELIEPAEGVEEETSSTGKPPASIANHLSLKVLKNDELITGASSTRSARGMMFSLEGTNATYATGDHISIRPCTPTALIDRFCQSVEPPLNRFAVITAHEVRKDGSKRDVKLPFPELTSVENAVGFYLSLRLDDGCILPILRAFAKKAAATDNETAMESLNKFLHRNGTTGDDVEPDAEVELHTYVELPALLEDYANKFNGLKLSFSELLFLLPPQKDRFYSIDTSVLTHPTKLGVTVGLTNGVSQLGTPIEGLCSGYLRTVAEGDVVFAAIHTSSFRCPMDDSRVIAAATGVGVAPFMGFFEERGNIITAAADEGDENPLSPATLYFGCRGKNDLLYPTELQQWSTPTPATSNAPALPAAISKLHIALSRDGPKEYVQDRMMKSKTLAADLLHPRCTFLYCGSAVVATHCYEAMLTCLQSRCGMTKLAAVHHLDVMRSEGRYQLDVWGLVGQWEAHKAQLKEHSRRGSDVWLESSNNSLSHSVFLNCSHDYALLRKDQKSAVTASAPHFRSGSRAQLFGLEPRPELAKLRKTPLPTRPRET